MVVPETRKERNVAIAIFYDKDLNIFVQERGKHSRVGEKYGFWGGRIEKNETPGQAIKRELLEELGFVPKKLDFWLEYSYVVEEEGRYKDWLINCHVFLSPVTSRLEKSEITEGKGLAKMKLDKVIEGKDFPTKSTEFMKKFRSRLRL